MAFLPASNEIEDIIRDYEHDLLVKDWQEKNKQIQEEFKEFAMVRWIRSVTFFDPYKHWSFNNLKWFTPGCFLDMLNWSSFMDEVCDDIRALGRNTAFLKGRPAPTPLPGWEPVRKRRRL